MERWLDLAEQRVSWRHLRKRHDRETEPSAEGVRQPEKPQLKALLYARSGEILQGGIATLKDRAGRVDVALLRRASQCAASA